MKNKSEQVEADLKMKQTVSDDAKQIGNGSGNDEKFSEMLDQKPASVPEKEEWKTVSSSIQFFDFGENNENLLTGTFCGTGKTINEGKGKQEEVKTYLIWDRTAKEFTLVPQWTALEKLGQIDGEEIGKKQVQLQYLNSVMDEKIPGKIKYHRVKLEFSNLPATGENLITSDQIQEVRENWKSKKSE